MNKNPRKKANEQFIAEDLKESKKSLLITLRMIFSKIFKLYFKQYWDRSLPGAKTYVEGLEPEGLDALCNYLMKLYIPLTRDCYCSKNSGSRIYGLILYNLFECKYNIPRLDNNSKLFFLRDKDTGLDLFDIIRDNFNFLTANNLEGNAMSSIMSQARDIINSEPDTRWYEVFSFCLLWDRAPIPMRFWTNQAISEYFNGEINAGESFNDAANGIHNLKNRKIGFRFKKHQKLVKSYNCLKSGIPIKDNDGISFPYPYPFSIGKTRYVDSVTISSSPELFKLKENMNHFHG